MRNSRTVIARGAGFLLAAALRATAGAQGPGAAQAADPSGRVEEIRLVRAIELPVPAELRRMPLVDVEAVVHDSPAGGSVLWRSARFRAVVRPAPAPGGERALVGAIPARPFHMEARVPLEHRMWVEFLVAGRPAGPRLLAKRGLFPLRRGLRSGNTYVMYVRLDAGGPARPAESGEVTTEMRPPRVIAPPPRADPPRPASDSGGSEAAGGRGPEDPPGSAGAAAGGGSPRAARRDRRGDEARLANNLYFEALRDYGRGDARMAMAKLQFSAALSPGNADVESALDRMRQETRSPLTAQEKDAQFLPSVEAMRQAYDLYFAALRRYSLGDLRAAQDALAEAARLDPTNDGVAAAMSRLRRELASLPAEDPRPPWAGARGSSAGGEPR